MESTGGEDKRKPRVSGEIRRVSAGEHPAVVGIPHVVGVAVVAVEPPAIVVVFDVEHVLIAVGIHERARCHPCHCPLITLRAVSYPGSPLAGNPQASRTKYPYFLSLKE